MLPSMPILFTRDSQDAFGNKIEPSTSFFNQNYFQKPPIQLEPPTPVVVPQSSKATPKEAKGKGATKKKDQPKNEPPKITNNVLETALVRSYYKKVQSRFSTHINLPTNKFVQFENILKTFDPNKETPVDLYKKIEEIFGEEHKDIVEEFLLFLKPGQAAEVGRFMDHFMMVQLTGFIELLQVSFSRKPTVLRKVLRALTTGVNSGDAAAMKARVLPHLRSNPRLTGMFKSLFPDERPDDSVYETGTDIIDEGFLTTDKGYDVWEIEESADNAKKLDAKQTLDTMYVQGRVFLQHGRLLRSARVSFPYSKEPYRAHARRLAPPHHHSPPPDDKNPKILPKRPKKPSPTKKDVNHNTNKEKEVSSPKTKKKKTCPKEKKNKEKVKKEIKKDVPKEKIKKEEPKQAWTRDEDKTMLQVLKGEAGSEQIFCKIRELLPHKSTTEIKERFCHVMNLLQQMAVGEVT